MDGPPSKDDVGENAAFPRYHAESVYGTKRSGKEKRDETSSTLSGEKAYGSDTHETAMRSS